MSNEAQERSWAEQSSGVLLSYAAASHGIVGSIREPAFWAFLSHQPALAFIKFAFIKRAVTVRRASLAKMEKDSDELPPWMQGVPHQVTHPARVAPDGRRLWKIGRKFYALEDFASVHPGGARMLHLARDFFEDSTFAFESHHTNLPHAMKVLSKFEIDVKAAGVDPTDAASGPELSPLGSFSQVLKTRVHAYLRTTKNGDGPTPECITLFYVLLASWILCFVFTAAQGTAATALLTGACGAMLAGFGHNWVHQPRYHKWTWVLDLEGLNGDTWYMGHLLMHHMYTNTPADNHWSILEPFLVTNPTRSRTWLEASVMPIFAPVVFTIGSFAGYVALSVRLVLSACGTYGHTDTARYTRADGRPDLDVELRLVNDYGYPSWLLGWCQMATLLYLQGPVWGFTLFMLKNGLASLWYLVVAFANHNSEAAWRIPERAAATTWAESQVYSCSDIGKHASFYASAQYLWLNYHTVHHLFPHTCMSKHPGIQRVLEQTCDDFSIHYCRGKSLTTLYGEMQHTFSTPRDLANVLAQVVL